MEHMTVLLTVGRRGKVNKCTAQEGIEFMKHFVIFTKVARIAEVYS